MTVDVTTTICLVRHGETDWNLNRLYQGWTDIPLNETGLGQAQMVAAVVAAETWDIIVSSPLSRAVQTAEAIVDHSPSLSVIDTDLDLRERGYGVAEGITLEDRLSQWPDLDWPGLEAYDVMADRAMVALDRIANRHMGQRVLVVCHGGVINGVLARISDGEFGTGKTVVLNTARSVLLFTNGVWSIETVTDASHLDLAAALDH